MKDFQEKKPDGVAVVIAAPDEGSASAGASIPKSFLGKAAEGLKPGDTGKLTVEFTVGEDEGDSLSLDFDKLLSCEGSKSREPEYEEDSVKDSFDKASKDGDLEKGDGFH